MTFNVIQKLLFEADEIPAENSQRGSASSSNFNVEMLTLAREAKGYTQKELANQISCHQSRLSKIEAGELVPQESDIQNFARTLGQNSEFFFRQGVTMPASVSFYRKTQTIPLKVLRQCNAQMNVCRLEIEKKVENKRLAKRELPSLPPEKNGGPDAVARAVRQKWGIGSGPIQHLTQVVEDAGCVIVDFPFPSTKLDGLCIRAPGKPPIVFLNNALPKSRRRLSLAHELGHLVMHTNPHEKVEDEAWEFAAEFLMPSDEIKEQFVGFNLDKLGQLKKQWGVSMQAILYRAKKMEKITESYNRFLWMQIGKCGYRVNEPFEDAIPEEKPTELDIRLKTNP
jgi:Zn-dependent peptidase ImmA (M78 family)/transcriptional regulator with XRE-family HTH domain